MDLTGAMIVVGVCAFSTLVGRRILDQAGIPHRGYAFITGFALLSLGCLLFFRIGFSLPAALIATSILLLLTAVAAGRRKIERPEATVEWGTATLIQLVFAGFVALVYLPFLIDRPEDYAYPPIFDLPKHLIAITSLQISETWPPSSPLFPGGHFTYNFGFYVLPAAIAALARSPGLSLPLFAGFTVLIAYFSVRTIAALASQLFGSDRYAWLAALFGSFVGGFLPFVFSDRPALGFHLNRLTGRFLWTDEPGISAIFVPQHIFSVLCTVTAVAVLIGRGNPVARALLAAGLGLAAALSSLILLPNVCMALVIGAIFVLVRGGLRRIDIVGMVLAGLSFILVLAPFAMEALGWSSGVSRQPLMVLPGLDSSLLFLLAAFGPVVLFAIYGMLCSPGRGEVFCLAAVTILSFIAANVLQYPDSGIKMLLFVHILLPIFAAVGFQKASERGVIAKAGAVAIVLTAVVINLPTLWSFAGPLPPKPAERAAMVKRMQSLASPILIDSGEQWDAAVVLKSVAFDFRLNRPDAYLPPAERLAAARFFDDIKAGKVEAMRAVAAQYSVLTLVTREDVWRPYFGEPAMRSEGRVLFVRERQL